ncbi:MAG TPA: CHRD domain-containing protein [Sphingomonas sp.]|nr:CHRD domain-containing protein [Sphingomonas sp.]
MRPIHALLAVAVVMPAFAAPPVKFSTALTGAAEVPGPGADKGTGSAELTLDPDKGRICYMLMASGTDTPTMAHIHKGAPGVAGGVVAPFTAPATGMSEGCVAVGADALAAILASPGDYYVNIHSAAFPKGALRGQLGK